MNIFYPPYDFIIVALMTVTLGYLISLGFKVDKEDNSRWASKFVPYSVSFIVISLIIAFAIDDLPLKFYGPDIPDSNVITDTDGPDIGAGLYAGMFYMISVLFNFILWGIAVFIIIKSFTKDKKVDTSEFLDDVL